MLILNRIICIQYMMTQLTRESPVPESVKVWPGPFWHRGDDQGLLNLFTAHSETSFFFFSFVSALLLTYLLSPTQTQPVHTSVHWQWGIASASEIFLNKFATHSYTCDPLRPVFFFLSLLRFSLFLTRGLLKLKVHDDKIINLTYFVLIGSI